MNRPVAARLHRRRAAKIGASLATTLALSACLVLPGRERSPVQPVVDGRLHRSGQPVMDYGVAVHFTTRAARCEAATDSARTDGNGSFSIAPGLDTPGVRVVPLAPSSPTFSIAVCLAGHDEDVLLFTQSYYGAPPARITVHCDLGLPASQRCTVTESESGQPTPANQGST